MKYAVVKENVVKEVGEKKIEMYRYVAKELNCSKYGNYEPGKVATVVKGRKIPKGTKVTIQRFVEDNYGRSYKSILFGYLNNPAVLVELPNGAKVWTIAENLELAPEDVTGWVETIEAKSWQEAVKIVDSKYKDNTGTIYYLDKDDKYREISFDWLDCGIGIYQDYKFDAGDCWACILDDWRKDTYSFRVFKKEPEMNNSIKYVSTGTPKRWDDFGGDTGLGSAIDAYNEFVKNYKEAC